MAYRVEVKIIIENAENEEDAKDRVEYLFQSKQAQDFKKENSITFSFGEAYETTEKIED